jgi:hypothetical protein
VAALLRGCLSSPAARLAAGVLKQPAVAPVVGVLLHSCLEAAEQEVAAGAGGSKQLRTTALQALGLAVQLVDSAECLAFFLPGGWPLCCLPPPPPPPLSPLRLLACWPAQS